MARRPFDPAKMAAAQTAASTPAPVVGASTGEAPPLRVHQLAAMIDGVVRSGLPKVLRVVGEVSNWTDRTHWYFSLKDADAVISCVMFQGAARKTGFVPSVGQEVVATGSCEFYKPQGRLTFRVDRLEPVGAGALELAFRKLVAELRALGWFDPERKRPLPAFPRRIAVITSRTGAALQDVVNTVQRRCPGVLVCLIDTKVQGPEAAPGIARAVEWVSANAPRLGLDVLIVTRGGGSMEDLWAFNDRAVAEAIVRCSIPVAAAIGHETDTTIAELVADERCATPTQAAMRCTPDRGALLEQVDSLGDRLAQALRNEARRTAEALSAQRRHLLAALRHRVGQSARRLESLAARLEAHRPGAVYERRRARLEAAALALGSALRGRLDAIDLPGLQADLRGVVEQRARAAGERLAASQRQLELVGPQSVLARGYSVTFLPDGRALRSVRDARPGQVLSTRLADGHVESTVGAPGTSEPVPPAPALPRVPEAPSIPPPPPRPSRAAPPRRKAKPADDAPGLFG
jgi:exodeoxyribonuclease VII large subunit